MKKKEKLQIINITNEKRATNRDHSNLKTWYMNIMNNFMRINLKIYIKRTRPLKIHTAKANIRRNKKLE